MTEPTDKKGGQVVRIMVPVQPIMERQHAAILQKGGYMTDQGHLDILKLMADSAKMERNRALLVNCIFAGLGIIGALWLKFY